MNAGPGVGTARRIGSGAVASGPLAGRAPLAPGAMPAGRQLGFLWGGVALLTTALALRAEQIAASLPACAFHVVTGVPCPACGSGGAALALARFDLAGALAASPLAALGWIGFVAGGLIAGLAALRGHALPEWPGRIPGWQRAAIVVVLVANWGYLIATR